MNRTNAIAVASRELVGDGWKKAGRKLLNNCKEIRLSMKFSAINSGQEIIYSTDHHAMVTRGILAISFNTNTRKSINKPHTDNIIIMRD